MNKVNLDKYTIDAATDFANNEADIKGFEKNGSQWKSAFKKYLGFAYSTISVGRNPRSTKNPRDMQTWPEIFSGNGFAGNVVKGYRGKGDTKLSQSEVEERIKSSISALAYLYLNGIYGLRTTTKERKAGAISADEMSDLQLRNSHTDNFEDINIGIAKNQIALTVIESALYEFLLPFFTMSSDDVRDIVSGIRIEGKVSAPGIAQARTEVEKSIRQKIGDRLKSISFKKLLLG